MAITPLDIQNQQFSHAMRGYDDQEVDIFLEQLATEIELHLTTSQDLKGRLIAAEEKISQLEAKLAEKGKMDAAISNAFIAAQQSADTLKEEAKLTTEKMYRDAEDKSEQIIKDAEAQKRVLVNECQKLYDSRDHFQKEYVSLLRHFMTEAQQAFPETVQTVGGNDTPSSTPSSKDKTSVDAATRGKTAANRPSPGDTPSSPKKDHAKHEAVAVHVSTKTQSSTRDESQGRPAPSQTAPTAAAKETKSQTGDLSEFGHGEDFDVEEID